MMNSTKIKRILALILVIGFALPMNSLKLYAQEDDEEQEKDEPKIMVSLGDSYSSGEGITPFYCEKKPISKRVQEEDWLAHRSTLSWPGQLSLPGVDGTMADNKDTYWYFRATSGAVTDNLNYMFTKEYDREGEVGSYNIPPQCDVFDKLEEGSVDYVTITIGGNDVDFSGIIVECCTQGIPFSNKNGLTEKFNKTWDDFFAQGGTRKRIKDAYKSIEDHAGTQAHIIVAGYPHLLSKDNIGKTGSGVFFSEAEVDEVNTNVTKFNKEIHKIVDECEDDGMNIYFVSVEEAFSGHEAYSKTPYINEVLIKPQAQDLKEQVIVNMKPNPSAYSIHPNEEGAKAYADCVQKKINEIEDGLEDEEEEEEEDLEDIVDEELEKKKKEMSEWLEQKFKEWLEEMINDWIAENCDDC